MQKIISYFISLSLLLSSFSTFATIELCESGTKSSSNGILHIQNSEYIKPKDEDKHNDEPIPSFCVCQTGFEKKFFNHQQLWINKEGKNAGFQGNCSLISKNTNANTDAWKNSLTYASFAVESAAAISGIGYIGYKIYSGCCSSPNGGANPPNQANPSPNPNDSSSDSGPWEETSSTDSSGGGIADNSEVLANRLAHDRGVIEEEGASGSTDGDVVPNTGDLTTDSGFMRSQPLSAASTDDELMLKSYNGSASDGPSGSGDPSDPSRTPPGENSADEENTCF
ncbi:hypothetical protein MNB_SUP05-SYMBIONT-4-754 [hydrothermal vent metagenome]|uniref:Uncharacterized protein n=1 Tax=hydrothermal vent metagenome TaxID=652676 RepID=A0A1W1E040_9ZZZZ|nr:hypothetical protein [Gammaproteobacteria bacterium]